MAQYIASLEKLKKRRVSRIAPGHGDVIDEPSPRSTSTEAPPGA